MATVSTLPGAGMAQFLVAEVSGGTNSFFRDTRLPMSMMLPSSLIGPSNAANARLRSASPARKRCERMSTMLTMARKMRSSFLSALTILSSGSSSLFLTMITSSSVVSTTANPILYPRSAPVRLKAFWSPHTSWCAERVASSFDLALNCWLARKLMSSISAISASSATIILSHSVVVGPRRLRVSERMAHRSMPAIGFEGRRPIEK
mmetsp:Transcript_69791/g.195085  ORF Transcript_69791/g.195085 Transcript_69791/m.195085 type:complete len:206 (+) Transcript_69791:133-750(+)